MSAYESQQVSFWTVHLHVVPFLEQAGTWPMLGSPPWEQLPGDSPQKLAALLDGARHWALRVETNQQARVEASEDVRSSADWSSIARTMHRRAKFRESHPWMKRVTK
jgi:hypothetical protein